METPFKEMHRDKDDFTEKRKGREFLLKRNISVW
jgi:hypothetical protein